MDKPLQEFKFHNWDVMILKIDGQPWWIGKQVAEILGYKNGSRDINRHVDEEDRQNYQNGTFTPPRGLIVIRRREMQIRKYQFGDYQLTTQEDNRGQIFFDAEQAAIGLGIYQIKNGQKYVRWERVQKYIHSPLVGKGSFISEPEFYELAIKADNEPARKFQHWVTSEVLPSIRQNGAYMTDEKAYDVVHNKGGLADLLQQAANQLRKKDIQIEEMKPKALFADAVATSKSTILIGQLAKMMRQNGINIGQNRLFAWLRKNGYLGKHGNNYNVPTQYAVEHGWFKTKETSIQHSDGHITIQLTVKVTGKGQQYFINKFLKHPELAG
jgi:anti-repressor protein